MTVAIAPYNPVSDRKPATARQEGLLSRLASAWNISKDEAKSRTTLIADSYDSFRRYVTSDELAREQISKSQGVFKFDINKEILDTALAYVGKGSEGQGRIADDSYVEDVRKTSVNLDRLVTGYKRVQPQTFGSEVTAVSVLPQRAYAETSGHGSAKVASSHREDQGDLVGASSSPRINYHNPRGFADIGIVSRAWETIGGSAVTRVVAWSLVAVSIFGGAATYYYNTKIRGLEDSLYSTRADAKAEYALKKVVQKKLKSAQEDLEKTKGLLQDAKKEYDGKIGTLEGLRKEDLEKLEVAIKERNEALQKAASLEQKLVQAQASKGRVTTPYVAGKAGTKYDKGRKKSDRPYQWTFRQNPADTPAWKTLQLFKVQYGGSEPKYLAQFTPPTSYKGQDLSEFKMAVKFPMIGWRYDLKPNKAAIIELTNEQYEAMRATQHPLQWMMYKVVPQGNKIDIHSSVNLEKSKKPSLAKPTLPKADEKRPEMSKPAVPQVVDDFGGEPLLPEDLTLPKL